MEDAYVIGIRLALDNGVAEGVAAVRGDLAALDRAMAASASQLETLRRAAALVLQPVPDAPPAMIAHKPLVSRPGLVPPDAAPEPRLADTGAAAPLVVMPRGDRVTDPIAVPMPVPVAPSIAASPPSVQAPARVSEANTAARGEEPRQAPPVIGLALAPMALVKPMAPVANAVIPDRPVAEPAQAPTVASAAAGSSAPVTARAAMAPPPDFAALGRALSPAPSARDAPPTVPLATREVRPALVSTAVSALPQSEAMSPPERPFVAAPPLAPVHADPGPRRDDPLADRPMMVGPVVPPWPPLSTGTRVSAPMAALVQPPAAAVSGLTGGLAPALPSAVPPPDLDGARHMRGDVFLDGARVGRWMAERMERDAGRPPVGPTFFDPRQSPAWAGATIGM